MDKYIEENEYLNNTLNIIEKELNKCIVAREALLKKNTTLSYDDKKRGEHFNINSLLELNDKQIKKIKSMKSTPYFGRFDFIDASSKSKSKIYIGKNSLTSDTKNIVLDWRAPICSLYYDSEVGQVNYEAPMGLISGIMTLKRQINIKNSELIDAMDSDLVTNDELLKPYLNINAENKMKTIIASIQKEQNNIIRKSADKNLIVQGVAGSGKTSVALHRIAYLIYILKEKIKSNQFLVIGPNNYFLNYISSILPELETDPVEQKTLIDVLNMYLNSKLSLIDDDFNKDKEIFTKISKFKTSLDYKKIIDLFINNYLNNIKVKDDFKIDDQIVFSAEQVNDILYKDKSKHPDYDSICNYFIKLLKENMDDIYENLNEKYRNIYINLPMDNPERIEAVERSNELRSLLKTNGVKLLKEYFKNLKTNTIDIYKLFLISLSSNEFLNEKEILTLQKKSLEALNKKKIYFDDIPALIHINYLLKNNTLPFKHIVIDEAQDYGIFHFDAIKEMIVNGTYSIYGDLAQSIYSYRSIESWDEVIDNIFDNNCELLNLTKSYRTTIEITENANNVLRQLNLNISNPVIRHGDEIEFIDCDSVNEKMNMINNLKKAGHKTIAIICKTEKEAKNLYNSIHKLDSEVRLISSKDESYEGGVCILTSTASKGLEFDAVILNDVSNNVYLENSKYDMHLLYVACTRALHKLIVVYNKNLCRVFEKEYEKDKDVKKLIKLK